MVTVKAWLGRSLPVLLYVLHVLTSLRFCRFGHWKDLGAPTPFLPRRIQDAVNRFERNARQRDTGVTVIRIHGMERSRPCRRFTSFPLSRITSDRWL